LRKRKDLLRLIFPRLQYLLSLLYSAAFRRAIRYPKTVSQTLTVRGL
jgi:hypothetical protein